MKNIMIDLETMGSGSNAAIVSIGAVKFDENGLGETFYSKVRLSDSVSYGMDMDVDTVIWWLKQNDHAREELTNDANAVGLAFALMEFETFIGKEACVWGNGSDFDNVILSNAWKKSMGILNAVPWQFWNNRCYRTMKSMFRDVKMERTGTHHNALDDAISQAKHLIEIINQKGIKL